MVGLVTLLLALVLGLLVFTAFSVFTTQRDEAYSLGPLVVEADLALELYGPDAAGGRAGLRAALSGFGGTSIARFFCFWYVADSFFLKFLYRELEPW
jgi:hypothetical protein